jgi:hypothetical protein
MNQALLDSLTEQRKLLDLLEACVKAGRLDWARETASQIALASATMVTAISGAAAPLALVEAAPAPEAPAQESKPGTGRNREYTPPSPRQVQSVLDKMFAERAEVGTDGNIVFCSFNGHLLDLEKAQRLIEPLKWFIKRAHVIAFQETNRDALKYLSNATGYGLNVSHRNERGQAVGILFHPRIKWLGQPIYHDYLCDIPGHPEWKTSLRPAVQRKVRDLYSGTEFDIVDIHTKSNLGGPEETAPVRQLQFEMLVAHLKEQDQAGTLGPVILAGDMNTPIDNPATAEIKPLLDYGLSLVPNPMGRSTYFFRGEARGQFDGFFARGLTGLSPVWIPVPPESRGDKWFYRELTDHMPAFCELAVLAKPEKQD